MSFLFPAFLFGAIGVAAPVWLHLRRRQRTNLRPFSALRFLDDQPAPRDMPLHLRNLPMLLLRMLAFLLLIAAFSWPLWRGDEAAPQSEVRIYLLDNTLSHQVGDAVQKARREIAKEIRKAGSHVQIGVIEIASRSRIVSDFGDSHEEAAAAVEALSPTHQRGSYLDGFRLAAAMLDRSIGDKRTILVYGDRQRNQWEENANVPPFLKNVEVVLAEAPGTNNLGNLFVNNTRVWRVPQREGSAVHLTLDLGAQAVNRAVDVAIRADDKEVVRRAFDMSGGETTLQADWKASAETWLRGEVEVTGQPDILPLDNRGYFAVPPLEPGKIALLSRSRYLRADLDPDISRGFWDVKIPSPAEIRAAAAADKPIYDTLVVDGDYLQSKDVREMVLRYLNNGCGVILFISRVNPLVEGFLRSIGFRPGAERTLSGDEQMFRYANLGHPVLNSFTQPEFGDLLEVKLQKYVRLDSEQAQGLLFASTGDPVLFENVGTKGKLLIFTFGADTESSNWPLLPNFLPFLDICLRYVRALPDQQISVEPGEIYFRKIEGAAARSFVLLKDGMERVHTVADSTGRLQFTMPDDPGIYELRRENGTSASTMETLLSVSTPVQESRLEYIQGRPAVLDTWILPPEPKPAASPEAAAPTPVVAQTQLAQHWWWLLLAAGAALLGLEMILQTQRRDLA